jgi:hypothetical protein
VLLGQRVQLTFGFLTPDLGSRFLVGLVLGGVVRYGLVSGWWDVVGIEGIEPGVHPLLLRAAGQGVVIGMTPGACVLAPIAPDLWLGLL